MGSQATGIIMPPQGRGNQHGIPRSQGIAIVERTQPRDDLDFDRSDTSKQYEVATWTMYYRILDHRQSRGESFRSPYSASQQQQGSERPLCHEKPRQSEQQAYHSRSLGYSDWLPVSSKESFPDVETDQSCSWDLLYDEVFELEL